jgi:hypothetical protein
MIRIPDHITEAEVLALIEGDMGSLPAERRDVVRAAIAGDPVLSRLVGEIRADASAVISMADVAAPAAIRTKVIEDLRRPVPRADYIREPSGGEIPVSSVVVSRESKWRRRVANFPARQLAVAASLTLAAGLGVWLISSAAKNSAAPKPPGPIALRSDPPAAAVDPEAPFDTLPSNVQPGPSLAINRSDPGSMTSRPLLVDSYGFATALKSEPADDLDLPLPAPAASRIPAAEAIALARAGQLIIRVRAVNEAEAHDKIDQFAMRSPKELNWRPLEAWELSEVTLALQTRPVPPVPYASDKVPATAKEDPDSEKPKLPPAAVPPAPVIKPIGVSADVAEALRNAEFHPLYTVEMDENERDLAALLERLSDGKKQVAEFVALEEPLPTRMPSTDPAAVLWWTRAPSNWTRRVCVPIVLETVR